MTHVHTHACITHMHTHSTHTHTHTHTHTQIKSSKHQRPISFDSEFHYNRAQLFLRPTLLTTPTSSCHDSQIPPPHWHDAFMNVSIEYPHLAGPPTGSSPLKVMYTLCTHQEDSAANALTNVLQQLDNHQSSNSCVWQYCTGGTELASFPGSPHVQTKNRG